MQRNFYWAGLSCVSLVIILLFIFGRPYLQRKWIETRYQVAWIPPGEFWMGGTIDCIDINSYPQVPRYSGVSNSLVGQYHKVYLDGFFIGRYEVTYKEYLEFLNECGRQENYPDHPLHPNRFPIQEISWNDANAYCQWLSRKTSSEYCRDWYSPDYFLISPLANPEGPTTGTTKVIKGGGQMHARDEPGDRLGEVPDKKFYAFGFRIVIIPQKK